MLFYKLRECEIRNSSKQQINCENFIIGCTVGFQAILDQRQVFTTLDESWIAHALYLSTRSCDAIYPVRESKSKLELFYRMFIKLFAILFGPRLDYMFERSFNYCYMYQRDLHLSSAEVICVTSWGYLHHFCTGDKYWRVAGYHSTHY